VGTTNVTITLWFDNTPGGTGVYSSSDDSVELTFKIVNPGMEESVFGNSVAEGIGQFTPVAGNHRLNLTNLNAVVTFPALPTYASTITNVVVLASTKSLSEAPNQAAVFPVPPNLDNGMGLYVDGLTNGTPYYLRLGMVDEAGNIVQYYPDRLGTDQNGVAHPECFGAAANALTCPFAATPTP
jgi:hypothetical protein